MLLPDDIRDLAGRAINFSKKQVFLECFLIFLSPLLGGFLNCARCFFRFFVARSLLDHKRGHKTSICCVLFTSGLRILCAGRDALKLK